ncbi:MAG: ParB/RepB/Spo0J family partition protein, partial [Ruminococcaceae bacterium]|nr:ParB/RepB/Spo0J family partition protein [Oscillospiraceae bacterium]
MAKKIINKRCPLQKECARTCSHIGGELNCDYYKNNGYGENGIPDQEEIRRALEENAEKLLFEDEIAAVVLPEDENKLVYLSLEDLYPHPDNPRKELGDISELAESIKAKGIMQNLTVVSREEGGYTVIIGHRRTAAAKAAGLSSAPCIIADMTPAEQVQTMLLENMQRSDLTVYEQAQGFQMMMDLGDTVDGIAEKTGFSKKTVRRRLKMAEL